ncbi:MAG TPA: YfcE family phosphodiesterase [Bacteroidota bacterium]|nr:YfcE family phosphodiesterase [Bacteroidota bacterium]
MRTLILSDIHGNLPALEAVIQTVGNFDACIFLGDVVDYGPFPAECISFLREKMTYGVIGNHDNAIAYDVDCGCRGDFKQFSEETRAWHKSILAGTDVQFLRSLRPLHRMTIDDRSILLAHATPEGNLFTYLQEAEIDKAVENLTDQVVLLGHTHVQFKKNIGGISVINPGSVGLARDGGQACYAIMENQEISLRRISYDAEETIRALWKCPVSQTTKMGLTRVLRGFVAPVK